MRDEVVCVPSIAHPIFGPDGANSGVEWRGDQGGSNNTLVSDVIGNSLIASLLLPFRVLLDPGLGFVRLW